MRSIYCTSCGSKISYSVAAPNFCSSCGEPMGSSSNASQKVPEPEAKPAVNSRYRQLPKKRSLRQRPEVSLAEDETDIDYVPDISKLQYEIDIPKDNIKSFKDIVHEQKGKE